MIPSSDLFDQSVLTALLDHDPLVQQYRAFFALFDWSVVEQWQARRSARGRPAHPESAYLKAFLLRQCEGLLTTSQLHRFLLNHPLLIIELGFHLVLDPRAPFGFAIHDTLPCRFWFTQKLRLFDPALLQGLLQATVAALKEQVPALGETVACDVKHIFAWVRENNPNVYVKGRFDVTHIPTGDPDCRLGVKKSTNQVQPDGSTKVKKVSLFGYGTGVATHTDPVYGDIVLADFTQPFNTGDVTYFRPLYRSTVLALDASPINITADAAFDAWYIYQCAALHGGIAAIPLNQHAHPVFQRDADGTPRCPKGLLMHPTFQFQHTHGYRAKPLSLPPALSSTHS